MGAKLRLQQVGLKVREIRYWVPMLLVTIQACWSSIRCSIRSRIVNFNNAISDLAVWRRSRSLIIIKQLLSMRPCQLAAGSEIDLFAPLSE